MRNKMEQEFLDILQQHIYIPIKIAGAYTRIREDKEDLINDIVLELWKSFRKFRGEASVSTWIYRVALNVSINYKRKSEKNPVLPTEGSWLENIDIITDCDENNPLNILYQCIEELDEVNKAIVLLYIDRKSHEEIASIIGLSKTNVGTRLSRIKEVLKVKSTLKI